MQIEDDVHNLLIQELGEDDVHYTPPGVWPARLEAFKACCNQRLFLQINKDCRLFMFGLSST
jgi:hypothetical protein